ncbi:Coenzyme A/diphosphate transporter [Schizosaccharomyces pombe]|uniref:Uncharacterized mitochondrial carrier PB17E12.12c n=1 Tax=Schizosaccharomyces pombe (strain 972 / ATCC 24843) TaxID=284812 RepID=YIKC_SCHPO|nr:putative coenzyme A/ diphosphate transporter [Schizosaccharomyces pombe]Q8TFH2.1 RecName: Full=Uncharacterized mitochondrial carrier PB17E12.12c [Schizosaccharomyces pombe 972h-]CAD27505.1 mitochondrial coenzyme A/ diphosphate transporter (predicted) [Schizosaccharomyces pombe]|eukprot:NP_001018227.1 putative coenzyme A/ diphosphate transporter [Schizosaccharomyces pombe]
MQKDKFGPCAPSRIPLLSNDLISMLSGGVAATVSRTAVSPLERMKIIFQVQNNKEYTSLTSTLVKIWNREGLIGFFRGNGTNCLRAFPYGAVQFATFNMLKQRALKNRSHQNLENHERLLFGAIAGAASCATTYPLDIARTRLSIETAGLTSRSLAINNVANNSLKVKPLTLWSTLLYIVQHEGGYPALYNGLPATLLNVVPYVSICFFTFEFCKQKFFSNADLTAFQKLFLGGFTGIIGQTLTFPADVLRRRFQVNRIPGIGHNYKNIKSAIFHIYKTEGINGFFRGYSSNMLKIIPVMSITWYTYETVSKMLHDL